LLQEFNVRFAEEPSAECLQLVHGTPLCAMCHKKISLNKEALWRFKEMAVEETY
jgi:hypothetical protein